MDSFSESIRPGAGRFLAGGPQVGPWLAGGQPLTSVAELACGDMGRARAAQVLRDGRVCGLWPVQGRAQAASAAAPQPTRLVRPKAYDDDDLSSIENID
jgi:hypothetical protein